MSGSRFERLDRGYVRRDEGRESALHVTGRTDTSRAWVGVGEWMGGDGCDSRRCGWCYLGAPHSLDAHAEAVRESAPRLAR